MQMTTLAPLTWSAPETVGFNAINGVEEGTENRWRITPVPRDVVRVGYQGEDEDGTLVNGSDDAAYAESIDEAKILIDVLRAGTDHLPEWRDQLVAAGFVRTYPEMEDGETLSRLWHDERRSGLFQIVVYDGVKTDSLDSRVRTAVHSTYESGKANFWHNVSRLNSVDERVKTYGPVSMRAGLPKGIDVLKGGVAVALAIRAARLARGGAFSKPLGGAPKSR
jgi:hypothetical protein